LARKLVLFAGQSAVGKTSLVNSIFGLNLRTGVLSEKTSRGKHTTTYSEIHTVFGTGIIDTPGFAVIDAEVKSNDLADFYPEYFERLKDCKFRGCNHAEEPDCAVKRDVENGILSKERYLRYLQIRNELIEKEKYL
jgi:ribosome biogenesis GTPase